MIVVPQVDVVITVSVQDYLTWGLSVVNIVLDPPLNPSLHNITPTLMTISALLSLIQVIDSLLICTGNPESEFLELRKHHSLTLHGSSGMLVSVFTIHTWTWMYIVYIKLYCLFHICRCMLHCLCLLSMVSFQQKSCGTYAKGEYQNSYYVLVSIVIYL